VLGALKSVVFHFRIICLIIFFDLFISSCRHTDKGTKIDISVNAAWEFRKADNSSWLPAHVPGSVISDLFANKRIDNLSEKNILETNHTDWEYRTTFDVTSEILNHDVVQLNFEGLNTYADVYLNDSLLVRANNKFIAWQFDCKSLLKKKGNKLRIYFHAFGANAGVGYKHLLRSVDDHKPSSGVFASFYGPGDFPLMPIGIWRPILIQAWSLAKIDHIYFYPEEVTAKRATYIANISVLSAAGQTLTAQMLLNNKVVMSSAIMVLKKGSNAHRVKFTIEKPKLWWTNGLGAPYLYQITFRLMKDQKVIHEFHQRLGIRTVEIVKSFSSDSSFYFKLNGTPIFVKGAGYIPLPLSTGQERTDAYTKVIESAFLSNFNMLRVFGKGIYEDDLFYDLCDEKGLLVWQDFMVNPFRINRDSQYLKSIEREAMENISRLRVHPCIALWWGNDKPWMSDKNQDHLAENTRNEGISEGVRAHEVFQNILPRVVRDYAYPIPYMALSKWEWKETAPDIGIFNGHMTGSIACGYGAAAFGSMKNGKDTALMTAFNSDPENKDIMDYIDKFYNPPHDFWSEVYLVRLAQSEIMKSAIESHRRLMPFCMGTLYRQLNGNSDFSNSTVDAQGWWKPSQYTVKDAFSHILTIPVRERKLVNVYVSSDALKNLDAILLTRLIDFRGNDLYVKQIPVEIKANATTVLLSVREQDLLRNADKKQCCLVVQLNQATKTLSQNILYFADPKNLLLTKAEISVDINESVKGYNLILKSPVLAKNVFIETVSKPCWFDDNNFDLLPGKRTKISLKYNGSKEELLKDIRIRSLVDTK
jgi:beta-mannosidase